MPSRTQCFPEATGKIHIQAHSGFDSIPKTHVSSSQTESQHGVGGGHKASCWGAIGI